MGKIEYKISSIRLSIGSIIVAIACGVLAFGSKIGLQEFSLIFGISLFLGGIIVSLAGIFKIIPRYKLYDKWDDNFIRRVIEKAPQDATIRILQTWIPDKEILCPFLKELLKEDKKFNIELLLMDHQSDFLLKSRTALRTEDHEHAEQQIKDTIKQFMLMEDEVNKVWERKRNGAKVNFKIELYDFLPFGPIYQIGEEYLFIGFYINFASSATGPMLIIRNNESKLWKLFNEHLVKACDTSMEPDESSVTESK